jgi:hypothetical protein
MMASTVAGRRSRPTFAFSRSSLAMRHWPSTTSVHFIVATFSRRCPMSSSTRHKPPNVPRPAQMCHNAAISASLRERSRLRVPFRCIPFTTGLV